MDVILIQTEEGFTVVRKGDLAHLQADLTFKPAYDAQRKDYVTPATDVQSASGAVSQMGLNVTSVIFIDPGS